MVVATISSIMVRSGGGRGGGGATVSGAGEPRGRGLGREVDVRGARLGCGIDDARTDARASHTRGGRRGPGGPRLERERVGGDKEASG
jgi:hypothetical protein